MNRRRARGLCEYGGCNVESGSKRRCETHAAAHAAAMKRARVKLACACGASDEDGVCPYYKSGRHVLAAAEAA